MFAAVEFICNKKGKSEFEGKRIELPSRQCFFHVKISCRKSKIPWQKTEKYLGTLANSVLLPEGILPPKKSSLKQLRVDVLPRLILFNSACSHIISQGACGKGIYIYDERALYKELIERIIMSFSEVTVITAETEAYEEKARQLYEKYGISLMVSDKAFANSGTAIDPEGAVPSYFSGRVYSLKKRQLLNAKVIYSREISLTGKYETMRPYGINALDFASALYESCGVKELSELLYENFS